MFKGGSRFDCWLIFILLPLSCPIELGDREKIGYALFEILLKNISELLT